MSEELFPTNAFVNRAQKEQLLGQKGLCIWLTGLSSSGKTTIAIELEQTLYHQGFLTQVLDGDNVRSGINANLGFTQEGRVENIRRAAEVAKFFVNSGMVTICCFISPKASMREMAREIVGEKDFFEVYVSTPLDVCESRDVKGLYKKARSGELKNFTGIDADYEIPSNPSLIVDTVNHSVQELASQIVSKITEKIKD